jgi:hypothetical protein
MKKAVILILSVFVFSCGREKISEKIIFPENYEGVAMVYYNVPDGKEEKKDDEGWTVIEFPSNGFLLTQYILPRKALYRREIYLDTVVGLKSLKFLAIGDSRNDFVNFKGIDTTQKYVFSMKGKSYTRPKDFNIKHNSGEVVIVDESNSKDFNYEFFIYCKPRQFKIISNKIFWNLDKLNLGIRKCDEDKLCYEKDFMERKFIEILR